jgi:anti-anti-sigma regulatory factor
MDNRRGRREASSTQHFVQLYSSSRAGLRAQASAAVDELLVREGTTLLLGLDSLAIVDDAVVAAVFVALLRLRESGDTVRLITGNPRHRKRLADIGLHLVLDIFATPGDAFRGTTSLRVPQADRTMIKPWRKISEKR